MKPLSDDPAAAREERRAALEVGRKLLEPLKQPGAHPRLKLAVQVHAAAAQVRDGEVSGGPLVDIESWASGGSDDFHATQAVAEGLEG